MLLERGEVGKVPKIYNQMLLRLTLEVIKREVCGGVKGGGGLGGRAGEGALYANSPEDVNIICRVIDSLHEERKK